MKESLTTFKMTPYPSPVIPLPWNKAQRIRDIPYEYFKLINSLLLAHPQTHTGTHAHMLRRQKHAHTLTNTHTHIHTHTHTHNTEMNSNAQIEMQKQHFSESKNIFITP